MKELELALGHSIRVFEPPFYMERYDDEPNRTPLADVIRNVISKTLTLVPTNGKICIPLSGGFDCRLFLWALNDLSLLNKYNIVTKTFGYIDGWDYVAAKKVCSALNLSFSHVSAKNHIFDLDTELERLKDAPVLWHEFYFNQEALSCSDSLKLTGFLGNTLVGNHFVTCDERAAVKIFLKKYAPSFLDNSLIENQLYNLIPFGFSKKLLTAYEELVIIIRQNNYIRPLLTSENVLHPFLNTTLLKWCLSLQNGERIGQSGYRKELKKLGGIMHLPSQTLMLGTLLDSDYRLMLRKTLMRVRRRVTKHQLYKSFNYEPFSVLQKNESFKKMVSDLSLRSRSKINSMVSFNQEILKLIL